MNEKKQLVNLRIEDSMYVSPRIEDLIVEMEGAILSNSTQDIGDEPW